MPFRSNRSIPDPLTAPLDELEHVQAPEPVPAVPLLPPTAYVPAEPGLPYAEDEVDEPYVAPDVIAAELGERVQFATQLAPPPPPVEGAPHDEPEPVEGLEADVLYVPAEPVEGRPADVVGHSPDQD